jgi:putative flippase GtrA
VKFSNFFSVIRFGIIGILAAIVHYFCVILIVESSSISPLLANIGGFAIAFWVSFYGHYQWSFKHNKTSKSKALPRFLATAIWGFFLNEVLLYVMLRQLKLTYTTALGIAIILVATSTFFLSKFWAFKTEKANLQ